LQVFQITFPILANPAHSQNSLHRFILLDGVVVQVEGGLNCGLVFIDTVHLRILVHGLHFVFLIGLIWIGHDLYLLAQVGGLLLRMVILELGVVLLDGGLRARLQFQLPDSRRSFGDGHVVLLFLVYFCDLGLKVLNHPFGF